MAYEPRTAHAYTQDGWTADHLQKALERALPQEAPKSPRRQQLRARPRWGLPCGALSQPKSVGLADYQQPDIITGSNEPNQDIGYQSG